VKALEPLILEEITKHAIALEQNNMLKFVRRWLYRAMPIIEQRHNPEVLG